jgi:hypothetical protein
MPEVPPESQVRHKSDRESLAISLCVSAIEPLGADETARVLRYIGERYLNRLRSERQALDAKIKIIEQHARLDACDLCRSLPNVETPTESNLTQ